MSPIVSGHRYLVPSLQITTTASLYPIPMMKVVILVFLTMFTGSDIPTDHLYKISNARRPYLDDIKEFTTSQMVAPKIINSYVGAQKEKAYSQKINSKLSLIPSRPLN